MRQRLRSESGDAVIELPVAVTVLLLPVAYMVLMFAPLSQHINMADLAASEAARAIATSPDRAVDLGAVNNLVNTIAINHGVDPAAVSATFCAVPDDPSLQANCGDLQRGTVVRVAVTVQMPLFQVPIWERSTGGFAWTATHDEQVDLYRSFG